MGLLRTRNETLIDKRESTFLTVAADASASADSVITVQDNSNFLTDNDYVLVGKIGSETSEIMQVDGAGTIGTSIRLDRSTDVGLRFAHPINTPIYRLDYNQFRLSHSTSNSTNDIDNDNVVTQDLQFDDDYTRYEDTNFTTGFYFMRFFNETTATLSIYSAAIPVGGHTQRSLFNILRRTYRELGFLKNDEMDESQIKIAEVTRVINDKQRDVVHKRLYTFAEGERSFSTVANQFRYVPDPASVNMLNEVSHDSKPLRWLDQKRWKQLHIDTDSTSSFASRFTIWNNEIWLDPKPDTAADTTAINDVANMSATATSVTVDSNSGFRATGGFYRFIIDSEVIYATGTTATTFTGLLRGREGTTAATHNNDAVITERDIVYTYQVEPADLDGISDETIIPEPEGLAFGAAEEIARGSLKDNDLADRLQIKYERWSNNLDDKYTKKILSSFTAVKDVLHDIDAANIRNPNDFPSSLTTS